MSTIPGDNSARASIGFPPPSRVVALETTPAPIMLNVASNGPQAISANTAATAYLRGDPATGVARWVQLVNLGTVPLKFAYDMDAAAGNFHGVLQGGTAADDGKGGELFVKDLDIRKLSIYNDNGSAGRYVVVRFYENFRFGG